MQVINSLNIFFMIFFGEIITTYFVVKCINKSLTPKVGKDTRRLYELFVILIMPLYDAVGNTLAISGLIPETDFVVYLSKIVIFSYNLLILLYIKKCFVEQWYFFYVISMISYSIIVAPIALLSSNHKLDNFPANMNELIQFIITLIITIILGILVSHIYKKLRNIKFYKIPKVLFLVFSYLFLLTPIFTSKTFLESTSKDKIALRTSFSVGEFAFLLFIFSSIIVIDYIYIRFKEIKRENFFLKEKNEIQYKNMIEIQKLEERLSQMYHDLGNHFKTMQLLMVDNNYHDVMKYINELTEEFENISVKKYCNHPIINSILSDKERFCQENNIDFEVYVNIFDNLSISDIDVMSIFSNLLDNAVESCMQIRNTRPYINIKSNLINEYLIIKVENSKTTLYDNILKLNSKVKNLYKIKGAGLKIINNIVIKYSGDKQIIEHDDKYLVTIALKNV